MTTEPTPMRCTISELTALTPFVHRVRLTPSQPVQWRPGQYLQLNMADGDKRFFSIANIDSEDAIELHIGASEHDSYAFAAVAYLQQQSEVEVVMPLGYAWLRQESHEPIILLAGGTGFSYARSIAQALLENGLTRETWFYWGCRNEQALYQRDLLDQWAEANPHFHFIPVVEYPDDSWGGRRGLVHKAVLEDFVSLQPYQIYAAGRFDMVGKAKEDFLVKGVEPAQMFSDAFEFL